MPSKIRRLLWLIAALGAIAALGDSAAAAGPGAIRISITNEYEADLDFGFLGKGSRTGKDRAEGVLTPQGSDYVGSVDAVVESTQQLSGLTGNCGPARYEDSQKLKVTSRPADGFNNYVQSVSFTSGRPGGEYLVLEFVPETATTQQPQNRNPGEDTVVNCHTLIETEVTITDMTTGWSDILFLPLNDSRWTMKDGGYIIALPASGVLEYTDTTIAAGATVAGPFKPRKSVWTIRVERLASSRATPALPVGCVEDDPNNPANQARPRAPGDKRACTPPPTSPQQPSQE